MKAHRSWHVGRASRGAWLVLLLAAGCGSDPAGDDVIDAPTIDGNQGANDSGGAFDAGIDSAFGEADASPNCPDDPVAPGSNTCPGECTGGCAGNVCTIDCRGDGTCDGDTIDCPPEYDCLILCEGVDACDTGTVNCPPLYGCTLSCSGGIDACGDQQINCGAGPCVVECGTDTCQGAMVNCTEGPCTAACTGQPPPTVNCGNSCSCTEC